MNLIASLETSAEHWTVSPGFGIYVHIPFCLHKCHYCDFNTYEGQQELHGSYVAALVRDIERWSGPIRTASSIYLGGGTPTLLSPRDLERILVALETRFGISEGAEITIEANPETVDRDKFAQLLSAGFNRFSIGVQSLAPHVLAGLGRTHSPEVAVGALAAAKRAGASNLNADLI
ncbi:MAG: radical SAM protein, partial [Actinomycetota bacterium]|nr:radical SAM protein [Actinomycetota bacterium]